MLTRLKVDGFKNLVDVDVYFGPFTCIAGPNGSGKSNLFDAIRFLSLLAELPLIEAAQAIRSTSNQPGEIRSLFHRVGDEYDDTMSFYAEMIIPPTGTDDLGQQARATYTFLTYSLTLTYVDQPESIPTLKLVEETLEYIKKGDAPKRIHFPHTREWRDSVIIGQRNVPFLSTINSDGEIIIRQHQDGQNRQGKTSRGQTIKYLAATLPRTVISRANALESPTALLARREMQSWRQLFLEPSALRRPDSFEDKRYLADNGAHIPATIERLTQNLDEDLTDEEKRGTIYTRIANSLSLLLNDVDFVSVERDEVRRLYTLYLHHFDGTSHPAQSLSDGTLRFLALAVLEQDPETKGIICLEEPENGIHPARIPSMINLLKEFAVDSTIEVDITNPLRQVIINTHSPTVVANVGQDELVTASIQNIVDNGKRFKASDFRCIPNEWRHKAGMSTMNLINLLEYLNPFQESTEEEEMTNSRDRSGRVIEMPEFQRYLPQFSPEEMAQINE